jgi:SAM-dependent methyltransferase
MINKLYKKLFLKEHHHDTPLKKHDPSMNIAPKSYLINLGCGSTYHSSWDNYDLVPANESIQELDLLKPMPFLDNSYIHCYCSHVIEHMPRSNVSKFIAEVYRIIKPGGVFRVVVPDLEAIVRNYITELDSASTGNVRSIARHEWMTIELLDQLTRTFSGGFMGRFWYSRPLLTRDLITQRLGLEATMWIDKSDQDFSNGATPLDPKQVYEVHNVSEEDEMKFRRQGEIHRWMYDRISLGVLLRDAGFQRVRVCSDQESSIPDFATFNLDTDKNGSVKKPDSLFMEGIR